MDTRTLVILALFVLGVAAILADNGGEHIERWLRRIRK
jgi:hypothetical protein